MSPNPSPSQHELLSEGDLNTSPARSAWQEEHLSDATKTLLARDEAVFLRQGLSTPCLNVVTSVSGALLTDHDGRRILDFHGNWVHQVGFGHPRVKDAIVRQLDTLSFSPRRYTNLPAIELAERLTSLTPSRLNKVLFAPGGTSAIGMALKLARAATGRHKTISMWDSFHGASLDAISIGGEAMFRKDAGPLLPGTNHVPPPSPSGCPFQCGSTCSLMCADYVEYVLEKEGDIGAVIAETVRSIPYIPEPDYWKRVRAACTRHGALLILDEIPHAFGRTGKMFTFEHFGIEPDMLVLGKGLGGGIFPLAALIAREDLDQVMPERALGHYTHEKNPVAAAAALAMLDVIEEEHLLDRSQSLGIHVLRELESWKSSQPLIRDVRGIGLMMGVEIGAPGMPQPDASLRAESIMYACLSAGLSFKVTMGNVLLLLPPLTISNDEMDRALCILKAAISEAAG